jgi:hypothetical protein
VGAAAVIVAFVVPAVATAGQDRVELCHLTGDGTYVPIEVADPAYETHMGHGDGQPGQAVPGMPGYVFDGDCVPAVAEPVAVDDEVTTPVDTPVTIDVLGNDTYVGSVVVSIQVFPQYGILGLIDVGVFEYTPNTGFFGTDSFTYQLCDSAGQCDPATVTITVGP